MNQLTRQPSQLQGSIMNFNSKETYIAARKDWVTKYDLISADIREARRNFNLAQRSYAKVLNDIERSRAWINVEKARAERTKYRELANKMLEERSLGKQEAARQWREVHVMFL